MAGHAKKCVERYCELANKTTQQLYKVSTPCIDDHHFKEEETKSVGRIVKYMLSNCSEMLTSQEILEDSKSTSGGTLCVFGSHTFVPIIWMCKKQTAVSHSSTKSEIISLDTGLRLDGLAALELWDLIVSVLGTVSRVSDRTEKPVNGKNKSHNKIDAVQDIDAVPSNVQSARQEALCI